jgi:hypothetical protein
MADDSTFCVTQSVKEITEHRTVLIRWHMVYPMTDFNVGNYCT